MRKIGMTGGVGSGKSEVLRFLKEEYGAVILMADEISHEQMLPGSEGWQRIREEFGDEILADEDGSAFPAGADAEGSAFPAEADAEGSSFPAEADAEGKKSRKEKENRPVDRKKLGAVVFGDPEKLAVLNGILHPAVKRAIERRFREEEEKGTELLVLEAALLLQDGYPEMLDEIWYVYVDPETRIKRLSEGRGYSREKSLSIMENQLPEEAYRKAADFILDNSGDWEETVHAIRQHCQRQQR